MQVDEEIGKVAQATPILISKSIELFLQHLINTLLKEAETQGIVRLTPVMLKGVINEKEQFDFLRHLVEKISAEEPSPLKGSPKKQLASSLSEN